MASFSRKYSDQDLRAILQAVVNDEAADHALTQAEYDKARGAHGYGHTPRAKYIAKRLDQSWASLAKLALREQAAKVREVAGDGGSPDRRQPSDLISAATVRNALRVVSRRLSADTLSAIQYERGRQQILAEAADREEAYALDEALPSAQRLQAKYDTWADACKEAGLRTSEDATNTRAVQRTNPGSYDSANAEQAITQALDWASEQGRELTQRTYQEYAVGREGIPSLNALQKLLKRESLGSFADFRSQVQAKRLKQFR